ncbi:MAG: DUF7674 family protein [Candidatus Sericytochromatia bacterium]
MLNRLQSQSLMLETAPGFQPFWQAYREEWQDADAQPGACLDLATFAHYVHHSIRENEPIPLPAIFQLIECLLQEGDEEVKTAAATCFLENLQNKETPPALWVPLLGTASRDYCQAWNAFTGVATPGLWPEGTQPRKRREQTAIPLDEALCQIIALNPGFGLFLQQKNQGSSPLADPAERAVNQLGLLAAYLHHHILSEDAYQAGPTLDLLEQFSLNGDDALRMGVAAGFIENMLNVGLPAERWVPFLGASMKAYAQTWAEMRDINVKGLP